MEGTGRPASLLSPLAGGCGPATHDISPGRASIHAHVSPMGGGLGPFTRTLARWVVAWAGCPPCHQWGLAAHRRVNTASRRARLPSLPHNSNPSATLPALAARRDRASGRPYAHGPNDSHVNPMTCAQAAPPRRMLRGLRAYKGVDAHIQGFACEQHTAIDTESAKVQTHCFKMTDFRLFSPNGSAVWRAHRLTSRPHHRQSGGIALHEGPTRRRHAASGLRVVQNPQPPPV